MTDNTVHGRILNAMERAETNAWNALARYKWERFGYHAATWVNLNKLLDAPRPSPFRPLVHLARERNARASPGR